MQGTDPPGLSGCMIPHLHSLQPFALRLAVSCVRKHRGCAASLNTNPSTKYTECGVMLDKFVHMSGCFSDMEAFANAEVAHNLRKHVATHCGRFWIDDNQRGTSWPCGLMRFKKRLTFCQHTSGKSTML